MTKSRSPLAIACVVAGMIGGMAGLRGAALESPASEVAVRLNTVPPTPFTDRISLEVRAGVRNKSAADRECELAVYLDSEEIGHELHRERINVPAGTAKGASFRWPTQGKAGKHQLIASVKCGDAVTRTTEAIEVVQSEVPSLGRITGAWSGIVHFDDGEGERWNTDLRKMTDEQWHALIHDMHGIGMTTVVITQVFLNGNERYLRHNMAKEGYTGRALYPSQLFPKREPIASSDPIETILSATDQLDMHVFLGVGIYAFFDFTPASLKWHQDVTTELYSRYGGHRSLYGWYVADECPGALLDTDQENAQIAAFFRGYRAHVRALTPEMPVMLAPNSFYMLKGEAGWAAILPNLDILCPFGWNRMRRDDAQGEAVAKRLQGLCDRSGTHFWMDLEVFLSRRREPPNPKLIGWPLWPRPMEEIADELKRYTGFEKVLCFQYPGMMTAPSAQPKLGGDEAVKLYTDYQRFLQTRE